jgi:hypothetical protein
MLAYMDVNEVVVRIRTYFETRKAENLEQWRRVRRLSYIQALTMGAKYKGEDELWQIEGDRPKADANKIEQWRKWLIDNGKIKGQA